MFNIVIKTIIIYTVIFFAIRLMGLKRSGELQPYELVITLMIADIVTTPMNSPATPLLYGIVPAFTLLLLYSIISFITLKSRRLRAFICGKPHMLICDGVLQADELKKASYNLNDLMEQLRMSGTTDIASVKYAVLETNGELSVLLKDSFSPPTKSDLKLKVSESPFYSALVLDGKVNTSSLMMKKIDKKKLHAFIAALGYSGIKDILILSLSETGALFLQDMTGRVKTMDVEAKKFYA